MQNIVSMLIPTALLLSSSLHAQGLPSAEADKAQDSSPPPAATAPQAPEDEGTPDPSVSPQTPTEDGSKLESVENEPEDEGEPDETNISYILRQSHSKSVEVFVDYNTFLGDKQYFTPVAYGVKAFCFKSSDVKFGLSLAMEKLYYGFDKRTLQAPGSFRFEDVKRDGSAFRIGAHGQFFLSNTLNIEASVFGASGMIRKGDGYDKDYYSRTGFSLAFGNQWSWDSYSIGFDWLTLTYNSTLKVGGENVIDRYPSNRNGGMIVLSALSFGAEW